jgi:biopolymer transport protein ExbD
MAFSVLGNQENGGRGRRRGAGALAEINIIPLVDVVLVLLIIFMLTAHVMEFGLDINVPEVRPVKDNAEELPVVSIARDGKTFLNGKPMNLHELPRQISRQFRDAKTVYVQADKSAIWDPIAQVIAELGEAKLGVKVVTKPQANAGWR